MLLLATKQKGRSNSKEKALKIFLTKSISLWQKQTNKNQPIFKNKMTFRFIF